MENNKARGGLNREYLNKGTGEYELHIYDYWTGDIKYAITARNIETLRKRKFDFVYHGEDAIQKYLTRPSDPTQLHPVVTPGISAGN